MVVNSATREPTAPDIPRKEERVCSLRECGSFLETLTTYRVCTRLTVERGRKYTQSSCKDRKCAKRSDVVDGRVSPPLSVARRALKNIHETFSRRGKEVRVGIDANARDSARSSLPFVLADSSELETRSMNMISACQRNRKYQRTIVTFAKAFVRTFILFFHFLSFSIQASSIIRGSFEEAYLSFSWKHISLSPP